MTDRCNSGLEYIAENLRGLAIPVTDLVPAARNAHRHDLGRDIPMLVESLRRFGQQKPIVATRTGEVIAGNGTLIATQMLGRSHIAVAWFDRAPDEALAYSLADNRTAELSSWDFERLSEQLADLVDLDPGLPAAVGWSDAEIGPLLSAEWRAPEHLPLPTEVADPPATIIFSAAQHHVVHQAVRRVREHEHDDTLTAGRCLELVCTNWLSGLTWMITEAPTVYLSVDWSPRCKQLLLDRLKAVLPEHRPSILVSLPYMSFFLRNRSRVRLRSWMLDSDAFSVWNSGRTVDLHQYIALSWSYSAPTRNSRR